MQTFNIYHSDREYATIMDNPVLGTVKANSQKEAEIIARRQGISSVAGIHAWPAKS